MTKPSTPSSSAATPASSSSSSSSSSTTPSSSSAQSPSKAKRQKPRRDDLLWKGILRKDQLERLEEISDFIVCPAFTGPFGGADKWGRLYVPGASSGFRNSRRIMEGWREKAKDEKYSWWVDKLAQRDVEPIKAIEIIRGELYLTRWKQYQTLYNKSMASRNAAKLKERQVEEAALQAREDHAEDAGTLLSLVGRGRSASTAGSSA